MAHIYSPEELAAMNINHKIHIDHPFTLTKMIRQLLLCFFVFIAFFSCKEAGPALKMHPIRAVLKFNVLKVALIRCPMMCLIIVMN